MRRKLPSIQALHCFEAAARHQNFTRAAQELNVTQGAVSRQLAALEDFLGVSLLKRTQHGMVLTPAGVDYARVVRQRLDALERDAMDVMTRRGQGDSLTLAAVPTFATRWLIPRLAGLAQEHPELVLHFESRTRPFLFGESDIDAALFTGTPQQIQLWAGTEATFLMQEWVQPVCHPNLLPGGRAVDPATLASLPLLQQATRPEAWQQWFLAHSFTAPRAIAGPRYEQFSMQAAAAIAGLGVSLMPTLLVQDELARGLLVVACEHAVPPLRAHYLVQPLGAGRPALGLFKAWLLRQTLRDGPSPVAQA